MERHFESQPAYIADGGAGYFAELANGRVAEISAGTYLGLRREAGTYEPPIVDLTPDTGEPMATCAACGQSYLTSPSDPPARLFCDPCLSSLEARQAVRDTARRNAVLNQGGLF